MFISRAEPPASPPRVRPFADGGEHLRAELELVELRVRREVAALVGANGTAARFDEFAGMYVSEEEMRGYLAEGPALTASSPVRAGRDVRLERGETELARRVEATLAQGRRLPLACLVERFGLADVDTRMLLCCLAPDIDLRFQRYFAFLQNDVARRRPTVQLLARLVEGAGDVLEVRRRLEGPRGLAASGLLICRRRSTADGALCTMQPLVPDSVLGFLVGNDRVEAELEHLAELCRPEQHEAGLAYERHHRAIVERLLRHEPAVGELPLTYVWGPDGAGKSAVVDRVAGALGRRVLRIDAGLLLAEPGDLGEHLRRLGRDARLHDALTHLCTAEALVSRDERPASKLGVLRAFLRRRRGAPVILTGTSSSADLRWALGETMTAFEIPYPSIEERAEIWSRALTCRTTADGAALIDGLAAKFRFTPGQIRNALDAAEFGAAGDTVSIGDLHRCCREESNPGLGNFARKIRPRYGWADIVLPPDTRAQLEELCNCVARRRTVYGHWGFDAKFSLGKGVNVLFAGASGCGKTMSAEIVARDLDLDLYKVDLSRVVSKYIGDTERNLSRIFDEAQTSNSILYFDEADALFGKRSEVKDAHDRYANIEIDFLLQRMEEHEGIVLLASNLKGNLDRAFTRRLTLVVEFPLATEVLRRQIWGKVFPEAVPLAGDLDLDFMARRFELSGGNIRNIAVNSAFLAARDEKPVAMRHVILATKREYQKMGRLVSRAEFGPYYGLVREEDAA